MHKYIYTFISLSFFLSLYKKVVSHFKKRPDANNILQKHTDVDYADGLALLTNTPDHANLSRKQQKALDSTWT